LEELKYVVDVNIHRRHLDEYQKAEIALRMEKLSRQIALERRKQFTRQTAGTAAAVRWTKEKGEQEDMDNNSVMRSASADAQGITEDDDDSGYLPEDEEEEEEEARLAYQPLPLIESEPSWRTAHPSKSRN
jgi:hypothetical protein